MTAISTEPKRQIDITIVRRWALGIGPGGHNHVIKLSLKYLYQ